jgi:hypothetical protein
MEGQDKNSNENVQFKDKSVHQTYNDGKPVGYGSSIQNSGHGNKTRPQDHDKIDRDKHEEEEEKG